jgi:hypothetical protein
MTLERNIADLFKMDEATWERHANPWSVWSRNTVLPLLIIAAWSRVWLGWWALIPFAIALLWNWYNPRIFPKPKSTDNWASQGVFGERVWLNRDTIPVPKHHLLMPNILSAIATFGIILVIWGVIKLAIWPTFCGFCIFVMGKLWFVDRMVWLYHDMKDQHPLYREWLY